MNSRRCLAAFLLAPTIAAAQAVTEPALRAPAPWVAAADIAEVVVVFNGGIKKLLLSYANLEKV